VPFEVIEFFRLKKEEAVKIIEEVRISVNKWRNVANKYQLSKVEQEVMSGAFDRHLYLAVPDR